jgi:hypothetical protein
MQGENMGEGEDSSAICGSWPYYRITAMPLKVGRLLPPPPSGSGENCLLTYQDCLENDGCVRVVFKRHAGWRCRVAVTLQQATTIGNSWSARIADIEDRSTRGDEPVTGGRWRPG